MKSLLFFLVNVILYLGMIAAILYIPVKYLLRTSNNYIRNVDVVVVEKSTSAYEYILIVEYEDNYYLCEVSNKRYYDTNVNDTINITLLKSDILKNYEAIIHK